MHAIASPPFSWAQAVRALAAPTIIFTATPYRNDYKYFKVDGSYVFNLPWDEAVNKRLIREVEVVAANSSSQILSKPIETYNLAKFVDEFKETLSKLPKGKKVIVHAGTFEALKALQRAFYYKAQEPCVLIHDAFTGPEKKNRYLVKQLVVTYSPVFVSNMLRRLKEALPPRLREYGCTSSNS